ncbi:hypothetical protein Adt_10180 [Abeliophyllum distichum]|uniref:Uncharacterized protein n=1 Tax=Abeliophyllum distichum TaxID=126358 RepID=A0ABD1UJK3_9LAMI
MFSTRWYLTTAWQFLPSSISESSVFHSLEDSRKGGIPPPYSYTALDSPPNSLLLSNMVTITCIPGTIIYLTNRHVSYRKLRCMDTLDSAFSTFEKRLTTIFLALLTQNYRQRKLLRIAKLIA